METSVFLSIQRRRLDAGLPTCPLLMEPPDAPHQLDEMGKTLVRLDALAQALIQQSERLRAGPLLTQADRYRNVLHLASRLEAVKQGLEEARRLLNKMREPSERPETTRRPPLAF